MSETGNRRCAFPSIPTTNENVSLADQEGADINGMNAARDIINFILSNRIGHQRTPKGVVYRTLEGVGFIPNEELDKCPFDLP